MYNEEDLNSLKIIQKIIAKKNNKTLILTSLISLKNHSTKQFLYKQKDKRYQINANMMLYYK